MYSTVEAKGDEDHMPMNMAELLAREAQLTDGALRDSYAADSLRVTRRFVAEAADRRYFHNVPIRERGPALAFAMLGRLGDTSDIEALQRLRRAHRYSSFALEPLKALDTGAPEL